jgi:uncharacterized protein (DUF779 family)
MPTIYVSPAAAEVIGRIRAARSGPLSFSIDGGCCEGTAPHLFENHVVSPSQTPVADAAGVPVYMTAAMTEIYRDAVVTIDVREDEMSEAMSLECEFGLRFVLREGRPAAGG